MTALRIEAPRSDAGEAHHARIILVGKGEERRRIPAIQGCGCALAGGLLTLVVLLLLGAVASRDSGSDSREIPAADRAVARCMEDRGYEKLEATVFDVPAEREEVFFRDLADCRQVTNSTSTSDGAHSQGQRRRRHAGGSISTHDVPAPGANGIGDHGPRELDLARVGPRRVRGRDGGDDGRERRIVPNCPRPCNYLSGRSVRQAVSSS